MATIRTLNVSIKARTKHAEDGFKKLAKVNENLMASFASSTKIVAGFGVALGVAAAAGLTALVKNSMETIDAQAKLADRLGGTIDGLRALQFVAGQSGSSADALNNGLEKMTKNFGDAINGTGEAKDALNRMRLSAQALARIRPERAFMLIGDALKNMKSPAEQASAAQAVFGRGGQELLTTLLQGTEAIEAQSKSFIKLAGSISQVDAKKVQTANDALGESRKAIEGLGDRLAIAAAPAITALANSFTKWAVEAKPSVEGVNAAVSDLVKVIGFAADGITALKVAWHGFRFEVDKAAEGLHKTMALLTQNSWLGTGLRAGASALLPSQTSMLQFLKSYTHFFKESGRLAGEDATYHLREFSKAWSDLMNSRASAGLLESIANINQEAARLPKAVAAIQRSRVQGGNSYMGIGNAIPGINAARILGDQMQAHLLRAVGSVQTPMFMLGQNLARGIEASVALAKQHLASMQEFADNVKSSLKTPLDNFKEFSSKLREAVKLGFLDGTEAATALGSEFERLFPKQDGGMGGGLLREVDLSRLDPSALRSERSKPQEVRSSQLEQANKYQEEMVRELKKLTSGDAVPRAVRG